MRVGSVGARPSVTMLQNVFLERMARGVSLPPGWVRAVFRAGPLPGSLNSIPYQKLDFRFQPVGFDL